MTLTECAWKIEALGWALGARIEGLDGDHARLIEERWPAPVTPHPYTLRFTARSEPTGLPSKEQVHAMVRWLDADRANIRGNNVELEVSFKDGHIDGEGVLHAHRAMGGLEAAHRALLVLWLARQGILVLHASSVVREGEAIVFLGESGAGKTTTARRLGREGYRRISDDMIAIDLRGPEPRLFPLPFERGSRPLVLASPPRCVAGLMVAKGAAELEISDDPQGLQHWSEAVISLAAGPAHATTVLDAFTRLARLPLGILHAPPAGKLAAPIVGWLTSAEQRSGAIVADVDGPAPLLHNVRMPSAPPSSRSLRRVPNVAWRVLDGSAVLVAPGSPAIRTLNAVGTRVWELADGREVEAIVEAVVNEFEVTRTQAADDVNTFIASLEGHGLLTVGASTA